MTRSAGAARVDIGIIGGSGLYDIEGLRKVKELGVKTPFGPTSDKVVLGELDGIRIAFLSRHGRGHRINPSEINYRANIYALKSLGVRRVISVSAVGSMKESIAPGDVVLPDQFIDLTKRRISTFFEGGIVAHVAFADPVCASLGAALLDAARTVGATAHRGGTYLCIEGPQFSTKGESRLYRQWGVSVIGMTNLPEAKLAREAELCYATVAMVTDFDCWHPDHDSVTVDLTSGSVIKNRGRSYKSYLTFLIPPLDSASEHLANATRNAVNIVRWRMHQDSGMKELIDNVQKFAPDQRPNYYFIFGYTQARIVHQILEKAVADGGTVVTGGCQVTPLTAGMKTVTVTYNGDPLEGATVAFLPDAGQPAIGRTGADGRFTFKTRGQPGAAIGAGKVTVTAVEQLMEFEGDGEPSPEELKNMSRSLVPEKYGHVRTSGLTAIVTADGENDFTFELKD